MVVTVQLIKLYQLYVSNLLDRACCFQREESLKFLRLRGVGEDGMLITHEDGMLFGLDCDLRVRLCSWYLLVILKMML